MSDSAGVQSRRNSFLATVKSISYAQLALVLIAAVLSYLQKDIGFALALVFGGLISLAGTWVHAWRVHLATEAASEAVGIDTAELVKGSVLKYLTVIALFALGMIIIKLEASAIVIGFVVAQMSFLFTRGYAARRKPAQRG